MSERRVNRKLSRPSSARIESRIDEVCIDGSGSKKRHLKPGQVVTIDGARGEYRIKWIDADGTLTCWGGTSKVQTMRSFNPERVKTIKRPPKGESERKAR